MRFPKFIALASLAVLAFFRFDITSSQAAEKYKIDVVHTTIGFTIMRQGFNNLVGGFRDFDGIIIFDEQNVSNSKVEVTMKTASFYSGWAPRDKHLRSPSFFNVLEFPEMKFVSTNVEKTGDNTGRIVGDLTLLGVTKRLTLTVKFNRKGTQKKRTFAGFSATGTLDRTDWGMNNLAKFVGPKVNIFLEVLAVKQ